MKILRLNFMFKVIFIVAIFFLLETEMTNAQVNWIVGGRTGLTISDGVAGFQIGPMAEVLFNRNMGVGTEFNINTTTGTPVDWQSYFKYYFDIPNSTIKPYADFGFGLIFVTGGPFFGIRFGGGANFQVAPNLYIPADLQLGPVFRGSSSTTFDFFGQPIRSGGGGTIFVVIISTGIRYYIP
jgi:hypothetical protein